MHRTEVALLSLQPRGGAQPSALEPDASELPWRPLRAARLHANEPLLPAFLLAASPPHVRPVRGPAEPGPARKP